jgi:hypothetical protein
MSKLKLFLVAGFLGSGEKTAIKQAVTFLRSGINIFYDHVNYVCEKQ